MSVIMAAFLGLLQGLAEFLPISSSGHLNLLQSLFGIDTGNQLLFNILLHVATLIPVVVVFWKDWWDMLRHPIQNKTLLLLFVASLPALIAKVLLGDQLDYLETHNVILGVCFLITGLFLILTQQIARRREVVNHEGPKEVGFFQAISMGCLQAVGMLPGISRSGSTIFGGVASGLNREKAAKFSFMMSAPAIVAGMLSELMAVVKGEGAGLGMDILPLAVGMVVACVSGYFAIRFMLNLITKISLNWFALYVIVLGIVVIVLQTMGIMTDAPDTVQQAAETAKALSVLL